MKKREFKFSFMQRKEYSENLRFWVFKKGKILPVAIVELTPYNVRVNMFNDKDMNMKDKIETAFEKFSGCSF